MNYGKVPGNLCLNQLSRNLISQPRKWKAYNHHSLKVFHIIFQPVHVLTDSNYEMRIVSKEIYRPPGARASNFAPILKMLDEREPPSVPKGQPKRKLFRSPRMPAVLVLLTESHSCFNFFYLFSTAESGKIAAKNKKKREQRKLKKDEAAGGEEKAETTKVVVNVTSNIGIKLTGNEEIDKQLKDLKKVWNRLVKKDERDS